MLSLPHSPASLFQGYTRSSLGVVLVSSLHTFTNDSKCHLPPTSQLLTPPRPSAYLRAHRRARTRTHTPARTCPHAHTLTHTHTPSPRLRPGGGLGPDEPDTAPARWVVRGAGPTGAVTADTEPRVLSTNSSRPRGFLQTRGPRRLPFRREASAPLTAKVSPEPQNLNKDRRGGRGGSSFLLSAAQFLQDCE